MPKSKERKKHLLLSLLFAAIAIWMLFYYLYPVIIAGRHNYSDPGYPVNFDSFYLPNIIVTVIIPFIVFVASLAFMNYHLMECDYFCKHEGWWGLFAVIAVLLMVAGLIVFIPPLIIVLLNSPNWFCMFLSLDIFGVNLFVLSRIANKRRHKIGATPYAN